MEKKLSNPFGYREIQMLGLLPMLLCFLLRMYIDPLQSFILFFSIGITILLIQFWWRSHKKTDFFMLSLGGIALCEFAVVEMMFPYFLEWFPVSFVLNLILLFNLVIILTNRERVKRILFRNVKYNSAHIGRQLTEFFHISKILAYVSFWYFIVGLILNIYLLSSPYQDLLYFYNRSLVSINFALLFVYEMIRVLMFNKMFSKEVFLPFLDDKFEIQGIISQKESLLAGSKYMHPHLRLILMNGERIFLLRSSKESELFGEEKYIDTPFSGDLTAKSNVHEKLDEMMHSALDSFQYSARLILRTKFENSQKKRYIYLYILNVLNENLLSQNWQIEGKFWTREQIEDNLGKNTFSSIFEEEYCFIENTIFYAYEHSKFSVLKQ